MSGKFLSCAIFFGTFVLSRASCDAPRAADNSSLYRLPRNVWPESYDIQLLTAVTSGNFIYEGKVSLHLSVTGKTNRVILHSDKLKVLEEKTALHKVLPDGQLDELLISGQSHDNDTEFYTIALEDELSPGKYLLSLKFVGEVLDDVFGFYRSSYRVNNETRWIGVTQFSTTFARRAFPCMDEPGFKATFQLSIGHYGNETVSSNTFPESRNITDRPNYYITKFSRTPRMSTYLLGWTIHGFSRVNSSDSRMWLWTRFEDSLESLRASPLLVDGPKIYSALEAWMALANPVSKVEHFAVPDFYFSAMENWGLITFRESVPLMLPSVTPLARIHSNLVTLAHEYAHTWFGNLVTPDFWSVAWLKEGFATYFAYVAVGQVHEDWRMMELFPLEVLQSSLLQDAEHHNRTMNGRNVGNSKSAKAAMDFVTYQKGASIIRMISDIVGEETFKVAMRSYLREKKYKAAMPSDVYNHLELALNSSVKPITLPVRIGEIIETWANQPNYPLIRVVRTGVRHLQVFQEPFQLNRSKINEIDSRSWWIPLKVAAQSNLDKTKLIQLSTWLGPSESKTIQLPISMAKNNWFLLNPQQIGYYRVSYDSYNWNALKKLLNSNDYQIIPITKRAALIDDSFNLARAGYEKYELPLNLIQYIIQEKEYEPWIAACRAILFLNGRLKNKPHAHKIFQQFARDLITPIYEELHFEENLSDSHLKKLHRNLILSTACILNLRDCVWNAKSFFDVWIADQNKILPAYLKNFVYRVGIVNSSDDVWTTLWHRFLKTNFHSEKEPMINALAATKNSSFINRYLRFSLDINSDIAQQYRLTIIQSVITGNSKNVNTALNYIESNLIKIIDLKGITFLAEILSSIGKEITSIEQEEKLKLFFYNNADHLKNISEETKKTIKLVQKNIAWIDNCSSQILQYLA